MKFSALSANNLLRHVAFFVSIVDLDISQQNIHVGIVFYCNSLLNNIFVLSNNYAGSI